MISTPKTFCPLCGGISTVLRTINVTRYADQVKYLCKCGCGESEIIAHMRRQFFRKPRVKGRLKTFVRLEISIRFV